MHKLLQTITFGLYKGMGKIKKKKDNFFTRLLKEDNNLSVLNFFLICTLAVGVILLIVPIIGMMVDIIFNHTMTINLSDMALYIGAVAGIFASGGLTSAWTEFAYSKYDIPPVGEDGEDMVVEGNENQSRRKRRYKYHKNEPSEEVIDENVDEETVLNEE